MSFRTYREVAGEDRSRLLEQVVDQRRRVADRLREVRRVVAIISGKGGVGKTYVATALALGLARRLPQGIGLLDADLHSPTAARMLGAAGPLRVTDSGVEPAVGREGVRIFSTDLLLEEGQPLRWREPDSERFVWRGALEAGALREFLADVAWGALSLLLIDLPPGSDTFADLTELVPGLTGAVAVTIPSEESRRSVERAMRVALERRVALLGVVENMAGYACPACGQIGPLFSGDAGTTLAARFGVPLLGRIPFVTPAESGKQGAEPGEGSAAAASRLAAPVAELVAAFLGALP